MTTEIDATTTLPLDDSPAFAILNTCVQCGFCLPACPTYRESYREQSSPRGRLRLMRAVHEGRLDLLDRVFTGQMYECLDCRACEAACPSGVLYGRVLEGARARIEETRVERGTRAPAERALRWLVFDRLFADMRLFRLASGAARFYQRSGAQALARRSGLLRALRLERLESLLPPMSRRFFVPSGQVYRAQGERRGRVALLTGCVMHTAYAGVHRATIRVLTRNGWEVVVPAGQGCCGALHAHAGDLERGRDLARRVIAAFEDAANDYILNNAAGCGAMLEEYAHLLAGDPAWAERAAALSARARDVSEVLALAPLRGPLAPLDLTVTYQEPCHLAHAQRVSAAPRALLAQLPGLRLVEMAEASLCCGSAGMYSVTRPEMSDQLLARKLDHARAADADLIVTANPGCALQLTAGLRRRGDAMPVRHLVEIVDRAYRHRAGRGPGA